MTSASELFYTRRSRFGRKTIDLGFDSSPDRISHHHNNNRQHQHQHQSHNNRRDRRDLDGCDPLRRSLHLRHHSHRTSLPEHESVRLDQASSQSASRNNINSGNVSSIHNRLRFNGNDRLPGAVLLARERLLQRLRGVSVSGNRLVDAGDLETEIARDFLAGLTPFTGSIAQTDRPVVLQETSGRPPGLAQEAMDCLHLEVFSNTERRIKGAISRESWECSICLESFLEGDELICLPCGHRFHSCCLDPWVRTCGDCPYCRTGIVL